MSTLARASSRSSKRPRASEERQCERAVSAWLALPTSSDLRAQAMVDPTDRRGTDPAVSHRAWELPVL